MILISSQTGKTRQHHFTVGRQMFILATVLKVQNGVYRSVPPVVIVSTTPLYYIIDANLIQQILLLPLAMKRVEFVCLSLPKKESPLLKIIILPFVSIPTPSLICPSLKTIAF